MPVITFFCKAKWNRVAFLLLDDASTLTTLLMPDLIIDHKSERLTWMTLLRRDWHGQQSCYFQSQKKENGCWIWKY